MAGTNSDYMRRLKKDGRTDLIEKIEAGEMTPYAASIEAGYRKRPSAKSRAHHLTHHWSRANKAERKRFMYDNMSDLEALRKEFIDFIEKSKERKREN